MKRLEYQKHITKNTAHNLYFIYQGNIQVIHRCLLLLRGRDFMLYSKVNESLLREVKHLFFIDKLVHFLSTNTECKLKHNTRINLLLNWPLPHTVSICANKNSRKSLTRRIWEMRKVCNLSALSETERCFPVHRPVSCVRLFIVNEWACHSFFQVIQIFLVKYLET